MESGSEPAGMVEHAPEPEKGGSGADPSVSLAFEPLLGAPSVKLEEEGQVDLPGGLA